jgi:hypothetical protein
MEPGAIGQIKVAYTKLGDKKLYSKMFDQLPDAIKFLAGKQNALIFNLQQDWGNGNYSWEVLPYGDYRSYKIGLFIKNNLMEIALLGVAIFFAVKYHLKNKGAKAVPAAAAKPAKVAADPTSVPDPDPEPTPA